MKKKKTEVYYRLDNILKRKAQYNVIIGERSNGKSYSVLEHVIKRWVEKHEEFALIRRWQEDVRGRRAQKVFSDFNNGYISKITNNTYDCIYYINGSYYFAKTDDETGKKIYNETTDLFGYTFSLADDEHNKSLQYPKVKTVFFDEFIARKVYLYDEFVTFVNVLSTIIRRRKDVIIFMCGNTVNKYCPYFEEMGLTNVLTMPQNSIDVYQYGESELRVAVEYCDSLEKEKDNNFYFAFDNPKLKMITTGSWELGNYPHLPVKYSPDDILLTYFIEFNNQLYQCEIISTENDNLFTYIHKKTTAIKNGDDIVYSVDDSEKWNYNSNIYKPLNKLQQKILYFYQINKVFYQNNDVGNAIENFLTVCKRK